MESGRARQTVGEQSEGWTRQMNNLMRPECTIMDSQFFVILTIEYGVEGTHMWVDKKSVDTA